MKERYLIIGFQPPTRRISLDSELAESATDAMRAVAGMRKAADVLLAWTPGQMRQLADLLTAMTPRQISFNRRSAELEERSFRASQMAPPPVHTGGPQSQPFLVISYTPDTEAVHLDTDLSDRPDAALSSVAGIRVRANVILAFTPEQLREMAVKLEGLTAEHIARNRRAAEQEEKVFYAELAARQ
jgi:hypothetical protein